MTVISDRVIYQSADYRLLDVATGATRDFRTQKIMMASTFNWNATVAFAGVGHTGSLDVSAWLVDVIGGVDMEDPFERLLERLLEADDWLTTVPELIRRHTFAVGAFVDGAPVYAVVSNHESVSSEPSAIPSARLGISRTKPSRPITFVSGQRSAVSRVDRTSLRRLAVSADMSEVWEAIVGVNAMAAAGNPYISPACFTTQLRITGEWQARSHNVPVGRVPLRLGHIESQVKAIADQHFGPGGWNVVGASGAYFAATDEFHHIQLREKPHDANVYNNYGAYLMNKRLDRRGAERQYLAALEIDPEHPHALTNLARVRLLDGELDAAEELLERAITAHPNEELVAASAASFYLDNRPDWLRAEAILGLGLAAHPESPRLALLRAELAFRRRDWQATLMMVEEAEVVGSDAAATAMIRALSTHLAGLPVADCISAYRAATALNPDNAALKLNLAQCLFIVASDIEAERLLTEALRLGLDDEAALEAHFYIVAHTRAPISETVARITELHSRGARLSWDIDANIKRVDKEDQVHAAFLTDLAGAMRGEQDMRSLDAL